MAGVKLVERDLQCPECQASMVLRPSKYGLFYGCSRYPDCKSAHGADPNGAPLGVPATKEVKAARIRAHVSFDTLWNTGTMKRKEAYKWMQMALGLSKHEAHIGNFDLAMCDKLVEAVTVYLKASR
jgi:hypothetical protein